MSAADPLSPAVPAADLDPDKFRNPEVYDLNREDKTHIAFGGGPHRCLGSHLARVMKVLRQRAEIPPATVLKLNASRQVVFDLPPEGVALVELI